VDPPKSDGIQPATANQDKPRPAAIDRDGKIRPAVIGQDDKIKPAAGDQNEPTLHRMEIISGPTRNVHYYAVGGSPTEQATLNKLSQAENELAYHESLLAIKQQYVNTESQMESRRREVQRKLYGLNMDDKVSNSNTLSGLGLGEPSPYGPGSGWTDRYAGPALGGAVGSLGPVGQFSPFTSTRGFTGPLGGVGNLSGLGALTGLGGLAGFGGFGGLPGFGGIGPFGNGFAGGVFPQSFGGIGSNLGPFFGTQGTPWSPYDINRVTLKKNLDQPEPGQRHWRRGQVQDRDGDGDGQTGHSGIDLDRPAEL